MPPTLALPTGSAKLGSVATTSTVKTDATGIAKLNQALIDEADTWCSAQPGGYTVPSYKILTNATVKSVPATRDAASGQLWSEWGNPGLYEHGWTYSYGVWTSDEDVSNQRISVYLGSGYYAENLAGQKNYVVCSKKLN